MPELIIIGILIGLDLFLFKRLMEEESRGLKIKISNSSTTATKDFVIKSTDKQICVYKTNYPPDHIVLLAGKNEIKFPIAEFLECTFTIERDNNKENR